MYDKVPEIRTAIVSGKSVLQISQEMRISVPEITQVLPQILEQIQSEYTNRAPFVNALNYSRLDLAIDKVLAAVLADDVDPKLLDRLAKALAQLTKAQKEFMPKLGDNGTQQANKIINNQAIFITKDSGEKVQKQLDSVFLSKYAGMLADGDNSVLADFEDAEEDD